MADFMNKIKNFFTGEEYEDEYDDIDEYEDESEPLRQGQSSSNVASFNRYYSDKRISSGVVNVSTQMGVCMLTPANLEEAAEACAELKKRNVVVISLEHLQDLSLCQQISDFISGVVYALDGTMQLISNKIIIVAPVNVELSGELKDQLQANGIKISNSFWG